MVTDEEWETLTNSYIRYFQFAKSLEKGIHAYNLAVDYLTNKELDDISKLLSCIADQWADKITDEEKDASMNSLKTIIKELGESERKDRIRDIFDSLSQIPPDETALYKRPHRIP
jgi:hypothetical protein